MLKKIRSSIIIKRTLSFLNEKSKLKFELKNGTKKEYDENNQLIYEDEYLDQ